MPDEGDIFATKQSALLNYYGQQLASHAVILLTTLLIYGTFIGTFKDRLNFAGFANTGLFAFLSIAASVAVYTLMRLFLYGQLASNLMWQTPEDAIHPSEKNYLGVLHSAALDIREEKSPFAKFTYKIAKGFWRRLAFSLPMGFLITYLIYLVLA